MATSVTLENIIEGIESQSDETHSYLNTETGEIALISDEEFDYAENEDIDELEEILEWQQENVEIAREILETDNYVALPDKFDIDEFHLMEKFSLSITNNDVRDELVFTIKGKGAFQRFKDLIHYHNLTEEWYAYRDSALKDIAKDWCEENGIDFVE